MDRIDLHMEVPQLGYEKLTSGYRRETSDLR